MIELPKVETMNRHARRAYSAMQGKVPRINKMIEVRERLENDKKAHRLAVKKRQDATHARALKRKHEANK